MEPFTDLIANPLAIVALAAAAVKVVLSLIKTVSSPIGQPSPYTPLQVRIAAIVLGLACGFALQIEPLTLPADTPAVFHYFVQLLGGAQVALLALGTHEGVDMVKKAK